VPAFEPGGIYGGATTFRQKADGSRDHHNCRQQAIERPP
jgi:hypothetical protein